MWNFSLPFHISIEERIHDDRPTRVSEQLAAQPNQTTAGHAKLNSHSPVAVVVHVDDLALARSQLLHHHAHKCFGNIHREMLYRFHQLAIDVLGDNLRLAHHELVALATHHFNGDRKLKFAAPEYFERVGRAHLLHAQR